MSESGHPVVNAAERLLRSDSGGDIFRQRPPAERVLRPALSGAYNRAEEAFRKMRSAQVSEKSARVEFTRAMEEIEAILKLYPTAPAQGPDLSRLAQEGVWPTHETYEYQAERERG